MKEIITVLERANMQLTSLGTNNAVFVTEAIKLAHEQEAHLEFVKRWVQRVFDNETSLEEFYGVLRYYEPFKPIIEPPLIIDDTGYFDEKNN